MTKTNFSGATDVVIVGGGIAGAAAAAQLAGAGHTVTIVERDSEYKDRVRGEGMVHWGFEAAMAMDLGDAITSAPGFSWMTSLVGYDELFTVEQAQRYATSLADMIPGIPGLAGIGHPELRKAITDVATSRGATLHIGVTNVVITPGPNPSVQFAIDGTQHTLQTRLIIGADGRESSVRRSLGIELHQTTPTMVLTGTLIDDKGAWDRAEVTIGVHGNNQLYVFPRADAVRLYVGRMVGSEPFTGADRQTKILEQFRVPSLPHSDAIADATPIGPCATFPMVDSWTRRPYAAGVVLMGDAAGWSNPVTGQGLAVAFRDALELTRLLLESSNWNEALFDKYAEVRDERMRRLRFTSAITDLMMAQGSPDRADRRERNARAVRQRPELIEALGAAHRGPWRIDAEAFEPTLLTTLAVA